MVSEMHQSFQLCYQVSCFYCTAQKMTFSIKDFFSKCDEIRRKLRILSNLLKKSLMENFIFCAVLVERSEKSSSKTVFLQQYKSIFLLKEKLQLNSVVPNPITNVTLHCLKIFHKSVLTVWWRMALRKAKAKKRGRTVSVDESHKRLEISWTRYFLLLWANFLETFGLKFCGISTCTNPLFQVSSIFIL